MPRILGFDHVQLSAPVGCEAAARAFFGGLLGLPEIDKPGSLRARGGCWFACGALELHVGVESPFVAAKKAHPAFRLASVDDVHALAERLEAGGVAVTWGSPVEGVARFHAADPWGNRLEFTSHA